MQKAVPLLKDRDIPFGIFIAPGRIDMSMPQYMSWKELRALHQHELATIGVSLNRYRHGVTLPSQKRKAGLNRAIARYREEFGHRPDYFAYPYGEYDNIFQETVRKYGFRAAFGQQSGVAHTQSDFYGLPRFTMTDNYGDVRRFRQTARALPLPIRDVIPASPVVEENPPKIGFSLSSELNIPAKDLKCYASNGAPVTKKIIAETRVELRIKEPFAARRGRVNCIVPENGQDRDTGKQRWRWHGMMFVIPDDLRAGGGEKD
jgi:peptidoglycan/xylan/chitin deacetylase (PgdA/CDA1 family)